MHTNKSLNSNRVLGSFKRTNFSRPQLLIFVLAFSLIGYLIFRSFAAAPLVASMEAEQLVLPSNGSVIADTSASAGKAIALDASGTATGSINFPSSVSSLAVLARGGQCSGSPAMNVAIDGTNLLTNAQVSSTSWASYPATSATTINSGNHNLSVTFTNGYTKTNGNPRNRCHRILYLDVFTFYGPTPLPTAPPTVSLVPSPTSVVAGGSATLTWSSTDATSCTASGAWSGSQPTQGSTSTGALNQTSTYNLSCTGNGGTGGATTTITVTAAPPPPVTGIPIPSTIASDCSVDVTSSLLNWINSVANSSTLSFGSGKCYRIDGTIELRGRSGLTFEGNNSSFKSIAPMTTGNATDDQRAMFRVIGSSNFVFHNMNIVGAYTRGGTIDESLQHAHGIDLRGTSAEVSSVNVSNVAGDCVYFGLGYDNVTRASGSYHNSTCSGTGRNGVSLTASNNVTLQYITTDNIGFIAFDVEPNIGSYTNTTGWGTSATNINNNTVGSYYLYAFAVIANAPNINTEFTNNTITSAKGMRIGLLCNNGCIVRANTVNISGNKASVATWSPAMEIVGIDNLTITNNTVPMTGGAMATIDRSCKVNLSGNTFTGGTTQATITNPTTAC